MRVFFPVLGTGASLSAEIIEYTFQTMRTMQKIVFASVDQLDSLYSQLPPSISIPEGTWGPNFLN